MNLEMKVKIFNGVDISIVEDNMNKWLEENSAIKVVNIFPYCSMIRDYFHRDPSVIANQWMEYIFTVTYTTDI
jgi:hypothetical protein